MNDQRNGHDFDFGGDGDGARGGGEVSGVGGARERDNKFLTRRRIKKNRIGACRCCELKLGEVGGAPKVDSNGRISLFLLHFSVSCSPNQIRL